MQHVISKFGVRERNTPPSQYFSSEWKKNQAVSCCCCCCCVRLRVSQYVATATAPVVIVDEQVTWLYEVTDDSVRLMSLLSDCCTLREQDPPPGPKWGAHWAPASRAAVVEGSLLLETFPSISFSAQTGFIVAQPKREEVDEALPRRKRKRV